MTDLGSSISRMISALVHIGIPINIRGMLAKIIEEIENLAESNRRPKIRKPIKDPTVPGAGNFFPKGPRVAKLIIIASRILFILKKKSPIFTHVNNSGVNGYPAS